MSEPGSEDDFKRALSATARAMAGDAPVEVGFGGDSAHVRAGRMTLPTPPRRLSAKAAAQSRGKADALALWLALHDARAHADSRPDGARARAIFDLAEQTRVEAVGGAALPGAADNLDAALQERCEKSGFQRMEDRQDAPLAEAVALLLRERLTGRRLPQAARGVAELWREEVEAKAAEALERLCGCREDQAAFGEALRGLIADLDLADELGGEADHDDAAETEADEPDAPDEPDEDGPSEGGGQPETEDAAGQPDAAETAADAADAAAADVAETDISDDGPMGDAEAATEAGAAPRRPATETASEYKVFTHAFDEEVTADGLCDAEELDRLRAYLDQQLRPLQGVVARLANRLQRKLLAKQTRGWNFDLEEGVLDTARLTRVITDPLRPLSFKEETEAPFRDTVVTLLLDNSGSMRGRPIMVAAVCADILARTLERCGVKVEILGFTTKAWKGGRAREAWLKAGRPPRPGRLNDLRHIIYKPADSAYRRARRHLGLMMKEGLLKENIDGEALQWAWRRLAGRPEERRILMVISDGAPVDDSTLSVNPGGYLDRHLRETIAMIETGSGVELCAIGIGHDVTRWYRRACTITDVDQLAGAVVHELADLFEETEPRGARVPIA